METNTDNIEFEYSVCAVVFGADESLLNVSLCNGFTLQKVSLSSWELLNDAFDTSSMGLRREYETARINESSLDVICVIKNQTICSHMQEANDVFDELTNSDLVALDNQFRILRLYKEAAVRFKKVSFTLKAISPIIFPNTNKIEFHSIIPIGEAINAPNISRVHIDEDDISEINAALSDFVLPIPDTIINIAHVFYDLSYHTDKFVSVTSLITSLEVLFLLSDEKCKKEKVSKRCASFICEQEEIPKTFNKLKDEYKKRSEIVHDGNTGNIQNDDILFLRHCVRKSIIKALNRGDDKVARVSMLRLFVGDNQKLFGE